MNIEIYAIDKDRKVMESQVFSISDDLFKKLAESEFSALGVSRKTSVTLDNEVAELKLVLLSPFVRSALANYLKDFLVKLLEESIHKMGDSPSRSEFQEYMQDIKVFPTIIRTIENEKFTHLYRLG